MDVERIAMKVADSVLAAANADVWRMNRGALKKELRRLHDLVEADYWEFTRTKGGGGLTQVGANERIHLVKIALGLVHPPWMHTFEEFRRVKGISERAYVKNVKNALKNGYPVPREVRGQEILD